MQLSFNKRAFTLVELIMVMAVIAILVTVLFVSTKPQKRFGETNDAKRKNDAQSLEQAIKLVTADTGSLPAELNITENQALAIVKAGGSVAGTYSCAVLGSSINKVDLAAAVSSVLPNLPMDPELSSASNETGYYIIKRGRSYDIEPCNTYELAATSGDKQMCGDGYCGSTESCSTCPQDCGECSIVVQEAGPNSPQLAANYGSGSWVWFYPTRVYANDTNYCYLGTLDDTPIESDINIVKADGSLGSTNRASLATWRTTPEPDYMGDDWNVVANPGYTTYGGATDLWGETWTAANINDPDFGVAIRLKKVSAGLYTNYLKVTNFGFNIPETAVIKGIKMEMERWVYNPSNYEPFEYIDHVKMTVYYTN